MQEILLNVEKREKKQKSHIREMKRNGYIPAVLYGKDIKPMNLKINTKEFTKAIGKEIEHVLVNLNVEGENINAILQDVQCDPMTENIIHLDFHQISLKTEIEIEVSIILTGKAKGVEEGGIVEFTKRELTIKCLPTQIPKHLEIDISKLGLNTSLYIKNIILPEGIKLSPYQNVEELVVSIVSPKAEVVEKVAEIPTETKTETTVEKKPEKKTDKK
ncbi:MAG: 50S ribosomal protein L25 [bacterium]